MEFENKVFEGIHYSRFVASFMKVAGRIYRRPFAEWLAQLTINGKSIPDNIINEICNFADNGKLELEDNARSFLKNKDRES